MPAANAHGLATVLATGHARLDEDHEALFALCGACESAEDAQLESALLDLQARFTEHFAEEDALMAGEDFSSRQCHLDEHAAVLQSFVDVVAALRSGEREAARRMARALSDWLPEHIDALDRHLAKFLFQRRTGGAPLLLRRRPPA